MVRVELRGPLTGEQRTLVWRYLGEAERFSSTEWVKLLEAFTRLGRSVVEWGSETGTFQEFYNRFIDQVYSDDFIEDLMEETEVTARAPALQARYARRIY